LVRQNALGSAIRTDKEKNFSPLSHLVHIGKIEDSRQRMERTRFLSGKEIISENHQPANKVDG